MHLLFCRAAVRRSLSITCSTCEEGAAGSFACAGKGSFPGGRRRSRTSAAVAAPIGLEDFLEVLDALAERLQQAPGWLRQTNLAKKLVGAPLVGHIDQPLCQGGLTFGHPLQHCSLAIERFGHRLQRCVLRGNPGRRLRGVGWRVPRRSFR